MFNCTKVFNVEYRFHYYSKVKPVSQFEICKLHKVWCEIAGVQVNRIEAALTAVQMFAGSMETQSRSGFVFYVPENHNFIGNSCSERTIAACLTFHRYKVLSPNITEHKEVVQHLINSNIHFVSDYE